MRPVIRTALAVFASLALACDAHSAPRGPEETCAKACETRAPSCTPRECARGCNLVLDRLVEREGDAVIACLAAAPAPCDDRAFGRCAARIGPHADGGPPAPPPPPDDVFRDQE